MSGRVWDLVVIGGGSAGLVAAQTAASFGAAVLLVERDRTGGECLWTGCVPSKALLAAASAAADARAADRLGVRVDGVRVDFAAVMAHVHAAVAAIEPVDSPAALRAAGVHVEHGTARFTGPDRLTVSEAVPETGTVPGAGAGESVRFRHAVVATGSVPDRSAVPGLREADARVMTTDDVWGLTRLPERLAVLGGGAVGCELGQAFARLGARVTLVEAADRLLAREDPDASRIIDDALRTDGVAVLTGTAVTGLAPSADGVALTLRGGPRVEVDLVVLATGRRPDTAALDLPAAGVRADARGIVVDRRLRTSNPRVYAAGDVTAHPRFTHVAGVHGATAATNAVLGLRRAADLLVPRVTFTSPEVAAVGARHGHTVRTQPHAEVDRAVAEGATAGFTRLVLDRRGVLVGATVVGPRAGEVLAELTLAVRRGLRARDLAATMHPYPTYGDGAWLAAVADVRTRLAAGTSATAVRALVAARRRWPRR